MEPIIINHLITFIAMRKIFTLFTMCMLAAVAWAADITFDPAVDKGNAGEQASAYEVPKDGVIISVSNGLMPPTRACGLTAFTRARR